MKKFILLLCIAIIITTGLNAQKECPLQPEKQGTFEILSRTDYAFTDCIFSRQTMTGNMLKLTNLINTVRKNPVLTENRGFMGRARIRSANCKDDGSYGVPAEVSFEFCDFYEDKGKVVYGTVEPPCWKMITNRLVPVGYMFSSDRFSRHPDFFTVPITKETIAPGVDFYERTCYVVYDPGRPAYWLPVTVKEAFDQVFAETKSIPDQKQRAYMLDYIQAEWAAMPVENWNKPATSSGIISKVGVDPEFPPIMKVNPLYWNKNRPESDIQFIYFSVSGNQDYLKERVEESRIHNSLGYSLRRFEASLDHDFVRSLEPLVK